MSNPIIIFGSSNPKGNTYQLIHSLDPSGHIPLEDLRSLNITPFDYDHKNKEDDYFPLMERLVKHDTIILVTPVYWYSMSAYMKTFFDRLTDCMMLRSDITEKLKGKTVYLMGTYGNYYDNSFVSPVEKTCAYMGMTFGGHFLLYTGNDQKRLEANEDPKNFWKKIV